MIPEYLDKNCIVYQQDAVTFLGALGPECAQLIWTKPPYVPDDQHIPDAVVPTKDAAQMQAVELCAAVADAATRVLTPTGLFAVCLDATLAAEAIATINKRTHLRHVGECVGTGTTVAVFTKAGLNFESVWMSDDFLLKLDCSVSGTVTPFIEANTLPGDMVVDPFCGSGMVLEAAVRAQRVAIVNDINSEAVAATIQRYKERCAR